MATVTPRRQPARATLICARRKSKGEHDEEDGSRAAQASCRRRPVCSLATVDCCMVVRWRFWAPHRVQNAMRVQNARSWAHKYAVGAHFRGCIWLENFASVSVYAGVVWSGARFRGCAFSRVHRKALRRHERMIIQVSGLVLHVSNVTSSRWPAVWKREVEELVNFDQLLISRSWLIFMQLRTIPFECCLGFENRLKNDATGIVQS